MKDESLVHGDVFRVFGKVVRTVEIGADADMIDAGHLCLETQCGNHKLRWRFKRFGEELCVSAICQIFQPT